MSISSDYDQKPTRKDKSRSCTDVVCFLIFLIFLAGLGAITTLGIMDHGLSRLIYGFDSFGNICDRQNKNFNSSLGFSGYNTTDLKYVFFFDYMNPKDSIKTCVKTCPNVKIETQSQFRNFTLFNGNLCLYNITTGSYDSNNCPKFPIYETKPIFRRCIPPIEQLIGDKFYFQNFITYLNEQWFQTAIMEVYRQLDSIGILALVAFGLSFILVFLLRYIAKIMVVLIIIASCLGSIGLSAFLWYKFAIAFSLNDNLKTKAPILNIEMTSKDLYLTYSILATVFTILFLLVIIFLRKRIGLVIKLFAEAQRAIKDVPFLLIMPVITFIFYFIFLGYWLFTTLLLASFARYGIIEQQNGFSFRFEPYKPIFWIYHVFGFIWVSEFIFACQAIVISGAVATWYFSRDKSRLGTPILSSIKRLLIYHLGSAAFGSLIIAIIKFPRYVLMYIQRKIKASESEFVKYIAKCCICCLWCLEKFMKFINYNAYTIINIEGKSFCPATRKAFSIVVENALRVATINCVGDFMLLLAKIAVTVATLIISLFYLGIPIKNDFFSIDELKLQGAPLILIGVISYLIAHCFFTVYEMVIDAIMVCFCVDCRANDGSEERPYFMSKSLRKFVDEATTTDVKLGNSKASIH